jgi:hypothetical protein
VPWVNCKRQMSRLDANGIERTESLWCYADL